MRFFINQAHELISSYDQQIKLEPKDWSNTPNYTLGSFSIPCFKLAKTLKENPAQLAQKISQHIEAKKITLFTKVVNQGPYLNFFVKPVEMLKHLDEQISISPTTFGGSEVGKGKTLIVEFSSPNIAKQILLHHLRSTAIGNALANIAKTHGYYVHKINYLGDWGTTHGKYIAAINNNLSTVDKLKTGGLAEMMRTYIEFCNQEKENPELTKQARECFKELEQGNKAHANIWALIRDLSIAEFKEIYKKLNVEFDYYDGESFYYQKMEEVIKEIQDKIGTEIDEGALITRLEGQKTPVLLKKDDGASLYITRDIAAAEDRYKRFNFDKMWYVVASQQNLHFKQLFAILKQTNKEFWQKLEHIPFGMLSFGNKTMKTRSGHTIILADVLDQGVKKATEIIKQKNPQLENLAEAAKTIGHGAILFFDLSQHRNHDVNFEWDRALNFEGDTSPFIQYTHARLDSLIEKTIPYLETLEKTKIDLQLINEYSNEQEVSGLINECCSYYLYQEKALEDKDPSQVSQSLLKICKASNSLYNKTKFLQINEHHKLALYLDTIKIAKFIIKHGLNCLGIQAPTKM